MNSTKIKCPNCNFEFPLEDALKDEVKNVIEREKQSMRQEMLKFKEQQDEKLRQNEKALHQKELAFQQKEKDLSLEMEKQKIALEAELNAKFKKEQEAQREEMRKTVSQDFENKIKI